MPVPVQSGAVPVDPMGSAGSAQIAPNAPFMLVHHAGYDGSWTVETVGFDKPTWVPAVDHFVLAEGSNGVETIAEGQDRRDATRNTREIFARQGIVVVSVAGAIVTEACRDPRSGQIGVFHRTAWQSVEPPPNPQANARVRLDRAGWNQWRAELARDAVIPPPHPSVVKAARKRLDDALTQARAETRIAPDVRDAMVAKAMGELDAFEKAVKPWEAPPAKKGAA